MARPRFIAENVTEVPWSGLKGFLCHEYDDHGNHRLSHNGRLGDWVCYSGIAVLLIEDRKFRAYTDYHSSCDEIEEVMAVLPRTLSDIFRKE
jgi:hypothetical protein